MRPKILLALVPLLLAATGCVTLDLLLQVQPDGSGRLVSEMRIQTAYLQLAQGVLGGGGEGPEAGDLFSEANLERMAARFGEGAELVSREVIEDAYSRSVRAVIAIPDVRTLAIDWLPVSPTRGTDTALELAPGEGGTTVLTLEFPIPETAQAGPLMKPADLEATKPLLAGLEVRFAIEVPGKLVATNSPFANGNRVTVAELDFDRVIADPKAVEAITTGSARTVAEVGKLLNSFPGARFHPEQELRIEYRAPKPAAKPRPEAGTSGDREER